MLLLSYCQDREERTMGLLDKIFGAQKNNEETGSGSVNRLHQKLKEKLPSSSEEELARLACIAGLMARVAHADMDVTGEELDHFKSSLAEWTNIELSKVEAIASLALTEVSDLAGLENHLYTAPLRENLNEEQRYQVLEALFALAASDGRCDNVESEEIRTICTGLGLHHREFISARASVHDKLTALQG